MKNNSKLNEKMLVEAAQKNIKDFNKLYDVYHAKIFRYLKSKVGGDEFIADDLTSATFEKALKNIKSFQWQGISFSAWIYKIANNTLIDYYRKQNVRKQTSTTHDNIPDNEIPNEEKLIISDSETRVQTVINQLPKREREIIMLKFYEGYTNKSIAKKLKISETNVSTIIFRTMDKIRKLMLARDDINI